MDAAHARVHLLRRILGKRVGAAPARADGGAHRWDFAARLYRCSLYGAVGTSCTASAHVLPPPWECIVTVAAESKIHVPSEFHWPPSACWLTYTVMVPAACVMVTGTAAEMLSAGPLRSSSRPP